MIEVFDTIEQRSEQWYELRRGIPTASKFASILSKSSRTRLSYLHQLAGERLTGEIAESYDNAHMRRGREQEPDALARYAFVNEVELRHVGFVRMQTASGWVGCSPDALVEPDGMVEVKCRIPSGMVEVMLTGPHDEPSEYRAQIFGGLWITGRQWCDLVCYHPDMPLVTKRIERDERYIALMAEEVCVFVEELASLEARFGDPQAVLRQQLEASL